MRLLDTWTGQFHWVNDPSIQRYAILSHVWSLDGEQSYQDLVDLHRWSEQSRASSIASEPYELQTLLQSVPHSPPSILSHPLLSDKIRYACAVARADGYRYIWIDSCCIDKSSSAELSEAINSMYKWYRYATVCYAYLADVDDNDDPFSVTSQFRGSQWHTRGWTLQELIASESVVFLSRDWHPIGTKNSLASVVEEVTGIDRAVLANPASVYMVSIARRMAWASRRRTTRVEDEAYSLMGIFGINMPTIYGEGRRSFLRLQQAILQQVPDQSIFAWGGRITNAEEVAAPIPLAPGAYIPRVELQLLATTPKHFSFSAPISTLFHLEFMAALGLPADTPPPTFAATPYGIRASLPIVHRPTIRVERSDTGPWLYTPDCIAILACQDDRSRFITLPLCRSTAAGSYNEYVIAVGPGILFPSRLWPVSSDSFALPEYKVIMAEILIRSGLPDPRDFNGYPSLTRNCISDEVVLHNWSRTMLERHGYWVWDWEESSREDTASARAHIFVLHHDHPPEQISVRVGASEGVLQRRLEVRHGGATTIGLDSTSPLPSQPMTSLVMIPAESGSSTEVPYRQHATYRLDTVAGWVRHLHVTISRFLDDEGRMKYGVEIVLHRSHGVARDIVDSQPSRASTRRDRKSRRILLFGRPRDTGYLTIHPNISKRMTS